jgi:cell division protein FtsI/penicillin-binding protein 2
MKKWNPWRLTLVLIGFLLFYLVIVSKLFYWQVVRSADLREQQQIQSSESLTVQAKRGEIVTSDNYPLVTNKYSYLLYANPKVISDKEEYASKLAPILQVDQASLSAQLSKNLFWVRLAQGLEDSDKKKVEDLHLDGLGFQQTSMRYYPEASMAAQLVGFLGKDKNGNNRGYFGLEGYYNEQLQGRDGRLYVIKDALGNPILNDIREEKKIDGRTLVLGLDRTVQYSVEKRLKDGIDQYAADGGTAIAMDTATGKILAMASFPNFDPQHYYDFPFASYVNPAITSLYEPGSTFKVLVMAAAIDQKKVTPDTRCTICTGSVPIDNYQIKTWDDKYFPDSTMTEVIQHSDNTGMVFTERRLGKDLFLSYLHKYGIGELTRVDLQGEVSGDLRADDDWKTIDLATASFGQGISVTPIELITAVNSIANGGKLMKPYVVSKVITEDGKTIEIPPEEKAQVISETTAKVMTWMMVNAVENGEAKWTKIPNYKIAGKTGTAQIPVAGHYDPTQTNASFVGFFPADKPKITMLVVINKPKKSIYGAETAAPIFFQIAGDLIHYYNIPPSY